MKSNTLNNNLNLTLLARLMFCLCTLLGVGILSTSADFQNASSQTAEQCAPLFKKDKGCKSVGLISKSNQLTVCSFHQHHHISAKVSTKVHHLFGGNHCKSYNYKSFKYQKDRLQAESLVNGYASCKDYIYALRHLLC